MKKELIGLMAVIAVVGLSAQSCSSTPPVDQTGNNNEQVPTEQTGDNSNQTVTVVFDGAKFTPSTVAIKVGDTVRFQHRGNVELWIGSDPHPTHTDWPSFDSKKAIETGGSYEFKFEKAGSFGFHNHLDPTQSGTVVVQ